MDNHLLLEGKWARPPLMIVSILLVLAGFVIAAINSSGWILILSLAVTQLLWMLRPFVRYRVCISRGQGADPWLLSYSVRVLGRRFIQEHLAFHHIEVRPCAAEWPGPDMRLYAVMSSGRRRWPATFFASLFCGPEGVGGLEAFCDAASAVGVQVTIPDRVKKALIELRETGDLWIDPNLARFGRWVGRKSYAFWQAIRRGSRKP